MASIGSKEYPLESVEPMKLARAYAEERMGEDGERGLFVAGGEVWSWEGGRWVVRGREDVVGDVLRWLEDAWVSVGKDKMARVGPTPHMAEQVVTCLGAVAKAPWERTPFRLGGGGKVGFGVPFRDVVVHVEGGEVRTEKRGREWVDRMVLPCTWEEAKEGKCERWEQAVEEWGQGDERWGELLRRWGGYLLVGYRGYRKWLLMMGKTGGGKGTIAHVLRALMGKGVFQTMDMETIAGEFGLVGVPSARVVNVSEVSSLEGAGAGKQKVSRFAKNLVGEDPITVNEKYGSVSKDLEHGAALMMSSNQVPVLPNEGQGLSNKMLVLPIVRSFDEGGAEYGLKERLEGELAGIAGWFVEGARRLEEARVRGEEMWPKPARASDVEMMYRIRNNPVDAFLESHFGKERRGFVAGRLVKRLWGEWEREHGLRKVPENQVLLTIERENGWGVYRDRLRTSEEQEGSRGLRGLVMLKASREDL